MHEVVTGVTIMNGEKIDTFSEIAKVTFYPIQPKKMKI